MQNEKLLTSEQVADRLQVSSQTVYSWLRTGELPSVRIGRLWRVRPSDLEEFLRKRGQKD
ncbi:MAG: helix-turn-helix domain-containing protein [Ktedonobacteraceae bacterium]